MKAKKLGINDSQPISSTSDFLQGGVNALEYQGLFQEGRSGCYPEHITH